MNEKLTREDIKEIVGRWFKNPPYPLPGWVSEAFINGLTDSQTTELTKAIDDHVLACIGDDESEQGFSGNRAEDATRNDLRAQQRQEGKVV